MLLKGKKKLNITLSIVSNSSSKAPIFYVSYKCTDIKKKQGISMIFIHFQLICFCFFKMLLHI